MGKYGEFTIIIDKNREGIFNILAYDLFGLLKRDEEFYYKYNTDIIYTFYDDLEQSYSQREIYTLTNDYENKYFCFDNDYLIPFIHPKKIIMSTYLMNLKIPIFDIETSLYRIDFSEIFKNMLIDKNVYKIIRSKYNCVYTDNLTTKNIFSIVKYESSNLFPKFIFYYDDTILNKKDMIYLIKKIINIDFN